MNGDHPPTHRDKEEVVPGPEITREMFLQWRSPPEGAANPAVMTNPVWTWLVKARINAYGANQRFDGPSAFDAGPAWCFLRFGQSETRLRDGTTLWIAGEHEDWYDPDFHIYNDVVIQRADGHIEILGYPRDVFPPTDFHTATPLDDEVILIGNLGYPKTRKPGGTQLLRLDLSDYSVNILPAQGNLGLTTMAFCNPRLCFSGHGGSAGGSRRPDPSSRLYSIATHLRVNGTLRVP